jgi:hypothetical protein
MYNAQLSKCPANPYRGCGVVHADTRGPHGRTEVMEPAVAFRYFAYATENLRRRRRRNRISQTTPLLHFREIEKQTNSNFEIENFTFRTQPHKRVIYSQSDM